MPQKSAILAGIEDEIADLERQLQPLTIRIEVLNSLRDRIAASKTKSPAPKRQARTASTPTAVE